MNEEKFKELDDKIYSITDAFQVAKWLGFELKSETSGSFLCKIHGETHPSFIAKQGSRTWKCTSKCGDGNIYHLVQKIKNCSYIDAIKDIALNLCHLSESEIAGLDQDKNKEILENLQPLHQKHREYLNKRGWLDSTIDSLELYSSGAYITFPIIKDNDYQCFKAISILDKRKKFFNGNDTSCSCYPNNDFNTVEILYIVAGEWDLGYLYQELKKIDSTQDKSQYKAITFTTGEKAIPKNILSQLSKIKAPNLQEIRIVYDNDMAGIEGSKIVANGLSSLNIPIKVYQFPSDKLKGYDTSDFFNDGYTIQDYLNLNYYTYNTKIDEKIDESDYTLEKLLLNSILFNNSFYNECLSFGLRIIDFKNYKTQEIFKLIVNYFDSFQYCDYTLLYEKIADTLLKTFLDELFESRVIATLDELKDTVCKIQDSSYKTLLKLSNSKIARLLERKLSTQELQHEVDKIYQELLLETSKQDKAITLDKMISNWRESFNKPSDDLLLIPTPFIELNNLLNGGLPKKRISILTAPVSMGKTTLSNMFALHAINKNIKTLIYTLESDEEETTENIMSSRTTIENNYFRKRTFPAHNKLDEIETTSKGKFDKNFYFIEAQEMKINDVVNDIKVRAKRDNIQFVIIDQINSFAVEGNQSRNEFLSQAIVRFKDVSAVANVCILINCQLTRTASKQTKNGGYNNVELEDLGETSNLEKLAHIVMTLTQKDNYSYIIKLPKNRRGKKDVYCTIYPELQYSRFAEKPNFNNDKYEGE